MISTISLFVESIGRSKKYWLEYVHMSGGQVVGDGSALGVAVLLSVIPLVLGAAVFERSVCVIVGVDVSLIDLCVGAAVVDRLTIRVVEFSSVITESVAGEHAATKTLKIINVVKYCGRTNLMEGEFFHAQPVLCGYLLQICQRVFRGQSIHLA